MKKVFAMVIAVLLMSSLVACTPKEEPTETERTQPTAKQPQMTVSVDSFYTDFEGVHIHIPSFICSGEELMLDMSWTNLSEYEVWYGESFTVERQEQGQWTECPIVSDNRAFHEIAYVLTSRETRTKTYNPTFMFVIREDGKYRFQTDFSVLSGETPLDAAHHTAWVEFTVSHTEEVPDTPVQTAVVFDAKYIRTNGYHKDVAYPLVNVIHSVQELTAYYEQYREQYDLGRKDDSSGFLDVCDQYQEKFFKEFSLLCIVVEAGSGSVQHCVQAVTAGKDDTLAVEIHRLIPVSGTSDMAQWHILVEVPKAYAPKTAEGVAVSLEG